MKVVRNIRETSDCIVISDNYIFSADSKGDINVFDISTFEKIHSFIGCGINITAMAIDGDYLYSSSPKKGINVWNIKTFTLDRNIKILDTEFTSFVIYKDNLYAGVTNSSVYTLSLKSDMLKSAYVTERSLVNCLAISVENECLYTSGDNTINVWDLSTHSLITYLEGHVSNINCLIISDGYLYSGADCIKVWDLKNHQEVFTLRGREMFEFFELEEITCLFLCAKKNYLYSGNENGTIKIWDLKTCREINSFSNHNNWVGNVSLLPDGCIYSNDDLFIKIWSTSEISFNKEDILLKRYLDYYKDFNLINVSMRCFLLKDN